MGESRFRVGELRPLAIDGACQDVTHGAVMSGVTEAGITSGHLLPEDAFAAARFEDLLELHARASDDTYADRIVDEMTAGLAL